MDNKKIEETLKILIEKREAMQDFASKWLSKEAYKMTEYMADSYDLKSDFLTHKGKEMEKLYEQHQLKVDVIMRFCIEYFIDQNNEHYDFLHKEGYFE